MSFAQSLLEGVLRIAEEKKAKKVKRVVVDIGELLMLNPEQLRFCYEVITRGTIAEGSELELNVVKPVIKCTLCGKEFDTPFALCDCGGIVSVEGGKDAVIRKVEMEV